MTPYEIKQAEKGMAMFEKIKKDSEEKRDNLEQFLIKQARSKTIDLPYCTNLILSINTETEHIKASNDRISEYKAKLINVGVNC